MKNKLVRNAGREVFGTVLMVIVALLIGAILVVLSDNQPGEAYSTMLRGAFGSTQKMFVQRIFFFRKSAKLISFKLSCVKLRR